jgi:hypothetical protein
VIKVEGKAAELRIPEAEDLKNPEKESQESPREEPEQQTGYIRPASRTNRAVLRSIDWVGEWLFH